jgi:hypothetical protein
LVDFLPIVTGAHYVQMLKRTDMQFVTSIQWKRLPSTWECMTSSSIRENCKYQLINAFTLTIQSGQWLTQTTTYWELWKITWEASIVRTVTQPRRPQTAGCKVL